MILRPLKFLIALGILAGCSPEPKEYQAPQEPVLPPVSTECVKVQPLAPLRFSGRENGGGDNIEAWIDPPLGGEGPEKFSLRFVSPAGMALAPGSYQLGSGNNARFPTCNQCVMVLEDQIGLNLARLNFATEGTLTLDALSPATGEYRGTLSKVVLRALLPSESEGSRGWDVVDTNFDRCLAIDQANFNTFVDNPQSCSSSETCVNQLRQVCDPLTERCVLSQCDEEEPMCDAGLVCAVQHESYGTGACYVQCQPLANNACPDGQECVSIRYDGSVGICKRAGIGVVGQKECASTTLGTGCQKGAVCQANAPLWPREQYCVQACDYFGVAPGCASGVCRLLFYNDLELRQYCYGGRCHTGGTCADRADVDSAPIGGACTSPPDTPCAPEAGAARGVCDYAAICSQVCALARPLCPLGTTCVPYTTGDSQRTPTPGIGVCR